MWSRIGAFRSFSQRTVVWVRGIVTPSKSLLNSEPNKLLPPKRPGNSYMRYCKERLKGSKEVILAAASVAKEWREMSPQQKEKYEEDFLREQEEYHEQMKEFSQNFASEKDKQLYLRSIKKQRKVSAYQVMKKDRVNNLPSEERSFYTVQKAKEDYKNLTCSELQAYQKMAETINGDKLKTQEKLNKKLSNPRKITVYNIMTKDRALKLPKEQRQEYMLRNAASDYKNLTAQERQEYEKMAKEYNEKREKIYGIIQRQCQHSIRTYLITLACMQ